tara:strand:+ start:107 stop:796 length:690 start_codon:yes stop_codon:yes gene_type:complete
MPTTTSFTALGGGNGFPECLKKCDVSDYDIWVTLGGFKNTDGSPTQTQINSSLINAMKLLWNSHSFSYTATGSSGGAASFDNDEDNEFREPFKTVCHDNVIGKFLNDTVTNTDSQLEASVSFSGKAEIHRFYDGNEDNENNFIGYGIKITDSGVQYPPILEGRALNTDGESADRGSIRHEYFSFVDEGEDFESSYVEISGMHFILQKSEDGNTVGVSIGDPSFNFYTYS